MEQFWRIKGTVGSLNPQKGFTGYVGMGEGGRGSGFRVLAQQTNQQRDHTVLPLSSLTDRGSVAVTFPGI